MTVAVRPAVPADLEVLTALEQSVFGPNAWTPAQLAEELSRGDRWYVVAAVDSEVIGFAGLYLSVPDADVQTVAVADDRQGRGVGGLLVSALVAHAWDIGCTRIFLEVRAGNDAALRLYEAAGFVRLGRRRRYYPDGSDAVTMRLRRHEVPPLAAAHG